MLIIWYVLPKFSINCWKSVKEVQLIWLYNCICCRMLLRRSVMWPQPDVGIQNKVSRSDKVMNFLAVRSGVCRVSCSGNQTAGMWGTNSIQIISFGCLQLHLQQGRVRSQEKTRIWTFNVFNVFNVPTHYTGGPPCPHILLFWFSWWSNKIWIL